MKDWLIPSKTFKLGYGALLLVPADSSSHGEDVTVCVPDINQPSLPTPFHSVLVSVSVFMALLTVFRSINSPVVLVMFSRTGRLN